MHDDFMMTLRWFSSSVFLNRMPQFSGQLMVRYLRAYMYVQRPFISARVRARRESLWQQTKQPKPNAWIVTAKTYMQKLVSWCSIMSARSQCPQPN